MKEALHLYGSAFLDVIFPEGDRPLSIGNDIVLLPEGSAGFPLDRAFETDYMMVIHIISGKGLISVDNCEYFLSGPCLLELIPHRTIRMSRLGDTPPRLEGVAFSGKFVQENLDVSEKMLKMHQFMIENPILELGENELAGFSLYLRSLRTIIGKDRAFDKSLCCAYLTMCLIISMLLPVTTSAADSRVRELAAVKVSVRFMDLLKLHYREEHRLGFYAEALDVTEKHLFASLKKETGKTASDWINSCLVSDAKKQLLDPDLSVADISESLHFKSQSDFGKFFKRHTGVSPLMWRRVKLTSV